MAKVLYSPEAKKDVKEIGRYTEKQWGKTQRNKYLKRLENRILSLAVNPQAGRMRYELTNSPLSFHEARHVIFYQEIREGIKVIRILYDRMDFSRHL